MDVPLTRLRFGDVGIDGRVIAPLAERTDLDVATGL